MDILELLKKPEGKVLEFKRDLSSPLGVLRAIVAFANTAGGVLVIGIEDKTNNITGITEPLQLEEQLANLVSDSIEPKVVPEIEIIPWRKKYLLVVQIFPSSVKPHYLKNQGIEKSAYIRVGSTNRLADQVIIKELRRTQLDGTFDEPIFEEIATHFRITIFIERKNKPNLDNLDQVILDQVKKCNGLSTKQIASVIQRSERSTRTRLILLVEKGLLFEVGTNSKDPKRKYFFRD